MKQNKRKGQGADSRDIYSNSRSAKHVKKSNGSKKRGWIVVLSIVLVLAILAGFGYGYVMDKLNAIQRGEINSSNVAVNEDVFSKDVINIALYGLDTYTENGIGRSDAIMILTVDKKHNKIKMTSIARDSYVYIDNKHGKDKITHAYVYKSKLADGTEIKGPELAVRVLNQNFNLDITDYVTVRFIQLANIIDALGGVYVDVNAQERDVINNVCVPSFAEEGITCKPVTKTGYQLLDGLQAVSYSRDRTTGSDIDRTNRQKEVLTAIFEQVKKKGLTKLNKLVDIGVSNCETSLQNKEIIELATWALTSSPTIESYTLPDKDCNPKHGNDALINGVWYYIYDLDIATKKIHDFINEEGYFAPVDETTNSTVSN